MNLFNNGNRTHEIGSGCGLKHYHWFEKWNRTHAHVKSEKSKTFLWLKMVNDTIPMVENWVSNP